MPNASPPKCPKCGKSTEEVYETGTFYKNWIWNEEKGHYEESKEKWGDDVTCRCQCGEQIDNTFLLDHIGPIQ